MWCGLSDSKAHARPLRSFCSEQEASPGYKDGQPAKDGETTQQGSWALRCNKIAGAGGSAGGGGKKESPVLSPSANFLAVM